MDHREHFKHPYWDQLNPEEKKAWLQAQIEKCLTEAGEEDDFLAACLEELDRMTPELSPSPQSVEMQLQKILSAPKPITVMSPPSVCMPQLKKQLISALIACVLLIVLMPPLYADAIGQEIVNPYSPITAAHLSGKEMEHAAPIPQQNTEDTPKAIYRREKYRPKQDIGSYVYRSRDAFFYFCYYLRFRLFSAPKKSRSSMSVYPDQAGIAPPIFSVFFPSARIKRSSTGESSVVAITISTTAGNISALSTPASCPFWATIRATSPREIIPMPMQSASCF